MDRADFRFLFRESEGTIAAAPWRRWTLALTGLCLLLAGVWVAISPWTHRDLAREGLFELKAFIAFVYLLVFAFALLLAQVSQYNLSAKRFRARGFNPGLAAAWPLSAFFTGAVFWAEPRFFGMIPSVAPWLMLLATAAIFLAQFFALGLRPDKTGT
jgi:hypothetical protein